MSGKAAKIMCTEKQLGILQRMTRSTTTSQRLVRRAQIIVMAFNKTLNRDIANAIGMGRRQVRLWRRRWQQSFDALVAIECRETHAQLCRSIEDVLSDAPRSGSPGSFTAEQVTHIMAVACEPPEQSGRPIDRWTHRELADEVISRRIVSSISVSQVGRYLAQAELQPHRSKYWLNQIEIVFGIVGRRAVRHGNFTSLAALKQRLLDFTDYFNRTFAKPFRWTYTGRPVTAEAVRRPSTWREDWASCRENRQILALGG